MMARLTTVATSVAQHSASLKKIEEEMQAPGSVGEGFHTAVISIQEKTAHRAKGVAKPSGKSSSSVRKGNTAGEGEPKESKMAAYYHVMQKRAPDVLEHFNDEVLATATLIKTIEEVARLVAKDMVSGSSAIGLFDMPMLSLSNKKKKTAYNDPDRQRESPYRKRLVQLALQLERAEEQFHKMKAKRSTPTGLPFWIGKCRVSIECIQESDIEGVRLRAEKASQENSAYYRHAKIGKGATMLRSDRADYVMHTVFEAVLNRLNVVRKQLPMIFTELVVFMSLDWETHQELSVSNDTLLFAWYVDSDSREVLVMGNIPQTNTVDVKRRTWTTRKPR